MNTIHKHTASMYIPDMSIKNVGSRSKSNFSFDLLPSFNTLSIYGSNVRKVYILYLIEYPVCFLFVICYRWLCIGMTAILNR